HPRRPRERGAHAAGPAARRRRRAGRPDPYGPGSDFTETLIVPIGLGSREEGPAWPRGWFREGRPWLHYPSRSNLRWLAASGLDIPPLGARHGWHRPRGPARRARRPDPRRLRALRHPRGLRGPAAASTA